VDGHIISYCLKDSLVNAWHRRMRAVLQTKSSSTKVRIDTTLNRVKMLWMAHALKRWLSMHADNPYALPSPVSSDRKVDLVFSDLPLQEPFRSHSSPLPLMQVHCRGHPLQAHSSVAATCRC
jgi:hypothetical protein